MVRVGPRGIWCGGSTVRGVGRLGSAGDVDQVEAHVAMIAPAIAPVSDGAIQRPIVHERPVVVHMTDHPFAHQLQCPLPGRGAAHAL